MPRNRTSLLLLQLISASKHASLLRLKSSPKQRLQRRVTVMQHHQMQFPVKSSSMQPLDQRNLIDKQAVSRAIQQLCLALPQLTRAQIKCQSQHQQMLMSQQEHKLKIRSFRKRQLQKLLEMHSHLIPLPRRPSHQKHSTSHHHKAQHQNHAHHSCQCCRARWKSSARSGGKAKASQRLTLMGHCQIPPWLLYTMPHQLSLSPQRLQSPPVSHTCLLQVSFCKHRVYFEQVH